MPDSDPFALVSGEPPRLSETTARHVARTRYGLDVEVSTLVSERDQNFRMTATDGLEYVLKIANAAEPVEVMDFQIEALIHIAKRISDRDIPIRVPQVVSALDGASSIEIDSARGRHRARMVTFLPGSPLGARIPSPALARNMGRFLAHLGWALRGFSHPGSKQSLIWDLQQAPRLRELVPCIRDTEVARAVNETLDDFERYAAPLLPSLRAQVIHSDMHADNVLVGAADDNRPVGIIDFGDMLLAPLIADVAIAASYLDPASGDPFNLIAEFVAGYHEVTPLAAEETGILFELIKTRCCTTLCMQEWRLSMRGPDDPYLGTYGNDGSSAGCFLCQLMDIPRDSARQQFRQITG